MKYTRTLFVIVPEKSSLISHDMQIVRWSYYRTFM